MFSDMNLDKCTSILAISFPSIIKNDAIKSMRQFITDLDGGLVNGTTDSSEDIYRTIFNFYTPYSNNFNKATRYERVFRIIRHYHHIHHLVNESCIQEAQEAEKQLTNIFYQFDYSSPCFKPIKASYIVGNSTTEKLLMKTWIGIIIQFIIETQKQHDNNESIHI